MRFPLPPFNPPASRAALLRSLPVFLCLLALIASAADVRVELANRSLAPEENSRQSMLAAPGPGSVLLPAFRERDHAAGDKVARLADFSVLQGGQASEAFRPATGGGRNQDEPVSLLPGTRAPPARIRSPLQR